MSQSSFNLLNMARSLFRTSINTALQALATQNSGATEPAEKYAYMWWADTATGRLKQRNAANTAWIDKGLLTDPAGTITGDLSVSGLISGSLNTNRGFKNIIINGDMVVAQRGTSFAGITTTKTLIVDRWAVAQTTSSVITGSQSSDIPTSKVVGSSLLTTVTTADTSIAAEDYSLIAYNGVEGFDTRQLCGKTFVVSFWVKSNITGNFGVTLSNSTGGRTYVSMQTINAANTWEKQTITVTGGINQLSGTWNLGNGLGLLIRFALAAGSTYQTATTGSFVTGNYLATSAQTNFVGTIGNTFAITDVQLEVGSVATDFEYLPYGVQLARSRRYYEATNATFIGGAAAAGSAVGQFIPFKVTKRAIPTLTLGTPAENVNLSTVTADAPTSEGFRIFGAATAAGLAYYTNTCAVDAEL